LLSITHRITGVLNVVGLLFVTVWLIFLGLGENLFTSFSIFLNSFPGKFILLGFTWSISFHLLSGLRHLFWDFGYGYDLKTSKITGTIVVLLSLLLTVFIYYLGVN
jgi:succinate dehydrogenase / fumarate reductase cytochrome b subunit